MVCNSSLSLAQSAADEYFDKDEMAAARAALRKSHGGQLNTFTMADRLEHLSNDGDAKTLWDGQGWIGTDADKLWWKTEGEYEHGLHDAELQLLYSRATTPFFDLQVGIRHDFRPEPTRTHLVIGAQGLAPYWFELDGALFLNEQGDVSARLEAEYELRLTQRLMLQPRIELNAALSDDEDVGRGAGLSTVDTGIRLRYEFAREFAPYVGVSWSNSFGTTKKFTRADGDDANVFSVVAGLRFWF